MPRKWTAVLLFWGAFLTYMLVGRAFHNRWFDGGPILALTGLYVGMGVVVIARCISRRSFEPFWRGRGYPGWFSRFAADEPEPKQGARLDPML